MVRYLPCSASVATIATLLVAALLGSLSGVSSVEAEETRFRLSGVKRTDGGTGETPIKVSALDVEDDDKEKMEETSQPVSEPVETSGVITGEVGEKEESAVPGTPKVIFRRQSLLPTQRVEKPNSEESTEVSTRTNFRLSARKQGTEPSGSAKAGAEASPQNLMGPPDPSALDASDPPTGENRGRDSPSRLAAEGNRTGASGNPDAKVSPYPATGGRSLGQAISAYRSGEDWPPPRDEEAVLPGELPAERTVSESDEREDMLFSNWLPGQQGTPFSAADAAEPVPGASTRVETWANDGYFPTLDDHQYIGDLDYPRGGFKTGGVGGPGGYTTGFSNGYGVTSSPWNGADFRAQNFNGIFPYDSPEQNFYSRHGYIFDPLDRAFGFIAPHDALVIENQRLQNFSASADGNFPFLTNQYVGERAHLKAGPLYFDFLSLGAGVLYSDFKPGKNYPELSDDVEDGWLSYIDVDVRGLLQITNNFYLSAAVRVMYLPESNRLAFNLGYGNLPGINFRLNYEDTWGLWDVLFYDQFLGALGVDIFTDVGSGAVDQAGRYYFGIPDTFGRAYDFFDQGSAIFINALGANATRPIGRDWRLWLRAIHSDYWAGWNFLDHVKLDQLGATMGYEGSRIPFSPYFSYDTYSTDAFERSFHVARVGGSGRLTENLSLNASGGYLWSDSYDPDHEQWLWRVGLNHDLSERTRHGVQGGQDFFVNDLYPEMVVADYIGYYIYHQVSRTVNAGAYAQWAEQEFLGDDGGTQKTELYGGYLDFRPADFTDIRGGAYYQETKYKDAEFEDDRWIYYGQVTQRILSRTSIWFRYQFEDTDYFDEHLYVTGVRRYF